MNKLLLVALYLFVLNSTLYSQSSRNDAADRLLSSNFEAFYSVDIELGYCMARIIEERVVAELNKASSFTCAYDSLANYVEIQSSRDSALRTFSWDRRGGGSWHDLASYVQYKTGSDSVRCQRLDSGDEGGTGKPTDVLIYDVHTINVRDEPRYLLLGWGTHGGGKHHCLARVYRILGDTLVQCDSIFEGEQHLCAAANRVNDIELEYDVETQILSYDHYEIDPNVGFYTDDHLKEKWLFNGEMFIKQ